MQDPVLAHKVATLEVELMALEISVLRVVSENDSKSEPGPEVSMSNEPNTAHRFKRLTVIELTLGDIDHHIQRFVNQPSFAGLE